MDLEEQLRKYFLREHLRGEDPRQLQNDDDLIQSGVLDSFAIVRLVTHLEEFYHIKVDSAEVVHKNFGSVGNLAAFVQRKLKGR